MNETQISALRRIIKREIAGYRPRSRWPAPGQHHSADKFVVTDGRIFVLLDSPIVNLPFGKRADKFIQIIQDVQMCGTHIPVPAEQIALPAWRHLTQQDGLSCVELSVQNQGGQTVTARFDPQLLLDATEVVGGQLQFFLGMGRHDPLRPTLLALPSGRKVSEIIEPVVLILSMQKRGGRYAI